MNALTYVDIIALAFATALLAILGVSDMKYRGVPTVLLALFIGGGVVFTVFRFVLGDIQLRSLVGVSLLNTGFIAFIMTLLAYRTGMVGIGDVLTVLATVFTTPYPPIGRLVRLFPAAVPLATIASALFIYIKIRETTVRIDHFPPGYRRVIIRRGEDLKRMNPVTEYPIYIEGVGFVYKEVFKGSPVENTMKLVSRLPDDAKVYTLPNYPFAYYFAIAYIVIMGLLLAAGFIENLGVIP
jgi:hypothetical protein